MNQTQSPGNVVNAESNEEIKRKGLKRNIFITLLGKSKPQLDAETLSTYSKAYLNH